MVNINSWGGSCQALTQMASLMLWSKDISMSSTFWRKNGQHRLLQRELQQPAERDQRWGHGGDHRSHVGLLQHWWRASSGPGLWLRWVLKLSISMCCIYSEKRQRGSKMAPVVTVTMMTCRSDNISHIISLVVAGNRFYPYSFMFFSSLLLSFIRFP